MSRIVYCKTRRQAHYEPVNPHLAITPKEMEMMTARGQAVSTSAMESFIYYNGDQLDGLPYDLCRGADMNTAWERAQVTRQKVRDFHTQRANELHQAAVRQKGVGDAGI